jgi:hypothetical protein
VQPKARAAGNAQIKLKNKMIEKFKDSAQT